MSNVIDTGQRVLQCGSTFVHIAPAQGAVTVSAGNGNLTINSDDISNLIAVLQYAKDQLVGLAQTPVASLGEAPVLAAPQSDPVVVPAPEAPLASPGP